MYRDLAPIVEVFVPDRVRYQPLLLGILDYRTQSNTHWIVKRADDLDRLVDRAYYCAGIIFMPHGPVPGLSNVSIPVVSMGPTTERVPQVRFDDRALGQAAADHLMDRGFTHFAFVGSPEEALHERAEAFAARLRKQGFDLATFPPSRTPYPSGYPERIAALAAWLKALPRPIGILASFDSLAREVIYACEQGGLIVPHEVSVVGVGNDPTVCEFGSPAMTSIEIPRREVGWEAARLLHELMQNKQPRNVTLAHCIVHERASSDTLATQDPIVAASLTFIRQHGQEGLTVDDLVRKTGFSRRTLEYRFRKALRSPPHEVILDHQVRHACALLRADKQTLETIAAQTGFHEASALCRAFRKHKGMTPTEYRRRPPEPAIYPPPNPRPATDRRRPTRTDKIPVPSTAVTPQNSQESQRMRGKATVQR